MFFMKYIPGNIYINSTISNISELAAYVASGFFATHLGIRISYFIGFMLATVGGLLLTFFFNMTSVVPVFVLLAKFGISLAF